jgi:hypothetical protein
MFELHCIFACFPDQGLPISIDVIDLWQSITPPFLTAILQTAPFPWMLLDFLVVLNELLSFET